MAKTATAKKVERQLQQMTMKIYFLNGPNLNLLGAREPEIYGLTTLPEIEANLKALAGPAGVNVEFRQSNHEGVLIDWIQEAGEKAGALVINPGAYTHTSIALRDALASLPIPKIELHLSNIHAREPFRRKSHVSPVVDAVICGIGAAGYELALDAARRLADKQ